MLQNRLVRDRKLGLVSNEPLRGRGIFGVGVQRHIASLEDSGFIAGPDVLMLSCSYNPWLWSTEVREAARFLVKLELPGLGDRRGAKTPCGPPTLTALSRSMSRCGAVSCMGLGAKDKTWVIFEWRNSMLKEKQGSCSPKHQLPPNGGRCQVVSKLGLIWRWTTVL